MPTYDAYGSLGDDIKAVPSVHSLDVVETPLVIECVVIGGCADGSGLEEVIRLGKLDICKIIHRVYGLSVHNCKAGSGA